MVEGRVKISDTRDTREFFPAQAHDFQGGKIVSNVIRSSLLAWDCANSRRDLCAFFSTYNGAKSSNASR